MILTNENDIYIFYEVIEQLEPQRILDMGMFLKRIGSVSRKAVNREVPEGVRLDGVDFFPEISFAAWKNVYDEILEYRNLGDMNPGREYDCTILLGIEEIQTKMPLSEIIQKVQKCSRYVLTDRMAAAWKETKCRIVDLKVEDDIYYLVDFGE